MSKNDVRKLLLDALRKNLVGPVGPENELIGIPFPTTRYVIGVLYPKYTESDDTYLEPDHESDDDDGYGDVILYHSDRSRLCPSSMGLSFTLRDSSDPLNVRVSYATYSLEVVKGKHNEKFFRRREHAYDLKIDPSIPYDRIKIHDSNNFYLITKSYPMISGKLVMSVFLINEEERENKDENDRKDGPREIDKTELNQRCLFSPSIEIVSHENNILARERSSVEYEDEDLRSLNLLYHDRHEFAVGHGCSVEWTDVEDNRCGKVRTNFIPKFHQQPLEFFEKRFDLDMIKMSKIGSKKETLDSLERLLSEYEEWIDATFDGINTQSKDDEMVNVHKEKCRTSMSRMRGGLRTLEAPDVFECFCFMNKAMALQRLHKKAADAHITGGEYVEPGLDNVLEGNRPVWRPFQMGFILQCLGGIVDPESDERTVLDLLWVPTGGGKTEAYLGLSAFTLAYRRLKNGSGEHFQYDGVSIIMRYTLRLLTIQQFQRAAVLFCAMESIRDKNVAKWGRESFRVGLYIGRDTTPNKISSDSYDENTSATHAYDHFRRTGERPEKFNPFQLVNCPWCGEELTFKSYDVDVISRHLRTACQREDCLFHRLEIPVLTVDEDIYRRIPSLLISTVDKFAQLPFNTNMGSLFGLVKRYTPTGGYEVYDDRSRLKGKQDERYETLKVGLRPPDLVIQDELHLINGPLGSMVGLYESSFKALCERNGLGGRGPKYIASTATIRNADDQVWELYDRDVQTFPSPGLDISDSFFVKEIIDDETSKVFIGLHPSAIGQKTVMIRTMSTILSEMQRIKQEGKVDIKNWDDYWTIVSYYDSIRALGSAVTTINDDVQNKILVQGSKRMLKTQELTSRVDSKGLTDILTRMSVSGDKDEAYDILACSNMFSVGVDVLRLGIMILNNQPKTSSEYIQATGRVGRTRSGLVIVIYNWNRPRDQSHYERFYDYHNRIQAHVEAMTVTPFSRGSRERALHAQYVAMIRHMGDPKLSGRKDAKNFSCTMRAKHSWAMDLLIERGNKRDGRCGDQIKAELHRFSDQWIDSASSCDLHYRPSYNSPVTGDTLMITNHNEATDNCGPAVMTPNSMRNIEEEVKLFRIEL